MVKSYKYNCLNNYLLEYKDYSLTVIKDIHLEKIRNWRNAQKEILRQNKNISKKEQILYFKDNVFKDLNKKHPKNILLMINECEIKYNNSFNRILSNEYLLLLIFNETRKIR